MMVTPAEDSATDFYASQAGLSRYGVGYHPLRPSHHCGERYRRLYAAVLGP